jgi:Flp pilus assembly protein TadG
MFGREKRIARDTRGQSLLELVIVTPLLLLLLAGIVDLGRAFYTYIAVANAARDGVRYFSRLPCTTENADEVHTAVYDATVEEAAANGINLADITIGPDPSEGCPEPEGGEPVQVTAVYTFTSMLVGVPMLGGGDFSFGQIPLRYTATMVNFGNDTP